MKKYLHMVGLCALASMSSFGAACADNNGATLADFMGTIGACSIGDSGQWTLSHWFLYETGSNGFSPVNIAASDIAVSFANIGSNGFSVTFGNNGSQYFSVGTSQDVHWTSHFWVTGSGGGATAINTIQNSLGGVDIDGAALEVKKRVLDADTPPHLSLLPIYSLDVFGSSQNNSISGSFGNALSVHDRVSFNYNGGSGTFESYTNTFFAAEPQGGVPEPMTFVMMGAGLLGVAVLRKRK